MVIGSSRDPVGAPDAMRALVRFDLSGLVLGPSTLVQKVVLRLTLAGFDAGSPSSWYDVQVHRALGPWIEGNGLESAFMPPGCVNVDDAGGVAWAAIDANNQAQPPFDPEVVDAIGVSQGASTPGDVFDWDVTPLAAGWLDGSIANDGIVLQVPVSYTGLFEGVQFGAREGDLYDYPGYTEVPGPRLVITTCEDEDGDGDCDPTCITIQRGALGDVHDSGLGEGNGDWPSGGYPFTWTGLGPLVERTLLSYDLSPVPEGAVILSATGSVYVMWNESDTAVRVHRVLAPWADATVNWPGFGSTSNFAPEAESYFFAGDVGYRSFDLSPLVHGWYSGEIPNHGILLEDDLDCGPQALHCYAGSEALPANRPRLEVCYGY
jgi:hypothetical protein